MSDRPPLSPDPLHRGSFQPFFQALRTGDPEALARIRHHFRTPLNQIIGYSEMLMESADEGGATHILRDLRRIHSAGGQLLAIINEALAPWKVESGRIDPERLRRDMRTPLNAVIGYTELCLDESAGPDQADLLADLRRILAAARSLLAFFEDHAFPGQLHDALPDPETAATDRAPAAILRGGAALPAFPVADLIDATTPAPAAARLLVVDDDPLNRDMLARRLRRLGFTVAESADGRDALQQLHAGNFDLVLLDIVMPVLDGFQTLEFMRADPQLRHLPVIMITALDDVESTVRCLEAGAEDFVSKPFNPVILRARLGASLEKKRLRDQEQAFLAQLQNERAKSERLLLNVLPRAVADRLKAGERTIVDSFLDATILFVDIVNFTRIASRNSPARTVQLLNDLFSGFDRIAEQSPALEKVKTIGDAYMLVSGVPTPRPDHVAACADAALEILEVLRIFNRRHQLDWQLRLGLHCGPVVAGIIGTRKFAYDLWGDTVNVAARMESQGQPGCIHVSGRVKRALEGQPFAFERVGVTDIKHIGPMETFFLTRQPG